MVRDTRCQIRDAKYKGQPQSNLVSRISHLRSGLPLRELEASASALLAVLLAFLAARIACDHTVGLQRLAQLNVELHQCAGNAELDSIGLAVDAAALDRGQDVEGLIDVGNAERLLGCGALRRRHEVLLEVFAVDGELA